MPNPTNPRIARIDRNELAAVPASWTSQQRGCYLRGLLQAKGIDAERLYTITYYPHRRCWLVTQPAAEPGRVCDSAPTLSPGKADAVFYAQLTTELRRTALAAAAAASHHSPYFGSPGLKYQLPAKPQEMTPTTLRALLGERGTNGPVVRFDGEGGWRNGPSQN